MGNKSIVFYNSEVHNLLEDKPDKLQLVNKLNLINSLEKWNKYVSYYITSNSEFRKLENLVGLIHHNVLQSDDNVFYVEIPRDIFSWIKNSSFPQIINQISSYFAFLMLEDSLKNKYRTVLVDNFFEIIKLQIHKIKIDISRIKLEYSDLKKYLPIFIESHSVTHHFDRKYVYRLFKYWKYYEKTFGYLPPSHFLSTLKINQKLDYIDQNLYNLKIVEFGSRKGYYNINSNRWQIRPNGFEYSNLYLDLWKDLYRENIKQKSNFFDEEVQIINTSYRYSLKELLQCRNCRTSLEFEVKSEMKIPKNHTLLCSNCYLEEYFEKLQDQ